MERLRTALLGVTGAGAAYLDALRTHEGFELVAVADRDPALLRQPADQQPYGLFEDYRLLIVESVRLGLDLLVVAVEPFQSLEFVELAAKHGIAVFHKAPPARNVREARQVVRRFEDAQVPCLVARPWNSEPAFALLHELSPHTGRIPLTTAEIRTPDEPTGWRGDAKRSGGGVLLNGAYETIDLLVNTLGTPEAVYAECTQDASAESSPNYNTEDVAVVLLRFGRGQLARVTALRGTGEPVRKVTFSGSVARIDVTERMLAVTPVETGATKRHRVRSKNPIEPMLGDVSAAWHATPQKFTSTLEEHLITLAVVEAAYLSAKTGVPESPQSLLG